MQGWVPVAFAMVIVLGAVGGHLAQMVLKELLPLLRTIAEQKRAELPAAELKRVIDALAAVDQRLERLEKAHHRLEEDRAFERQLRAGGSREKTDL